MNNKSIGVFDSGLGGLTAVKSLLRELPNENIVYFGDTGRLPYGTKTEDTIIKYAIGDVNFLLSKDVKMIIIACGTASSVALNTLKKKFDVPIIGVVEAGAKAAVSKTKNKRIGVLGTGTTIKSNSYLNEIKKLLPEATVYQKACPLFVPLVENGHFDTKVTELVIEEYVTEVKNAGVDTLILGCTHYPLLQNAISRFMGNDVKIINVCEELAKTVRGVLGEENLASDSMKAECEYFVSDDPDGFEKLGGVFLDRKIYGQVKKIDIEKY